VPSIERRRREDRGAEGTDVGGFGSAPLRRFHTSLEFTTSPVTGVGGGRGAAGDIAYSV